MEVDKLYNDMIANNIAPNLTKLEFKRVRNTFYYSPGKNWGIIDFQKSTKSSSDKIIFTVNVGVASERIINFLNLIDQNKRPGIWDTQWRVRLGQLMQLGDFWWTIDQVTNVSELGQTLFNNILTTAIQEIQKYMRD